jgi:hypothetical protein
MSRLPARVAKSAALGSILLVLPLAAALAQAKDVKISGMGIRTCGEWQQWKEARNAESRAMVLEWALGFIAGHNVYARTGGTMASPVVASVSVLIPLLDAYCLKNPQERILSGVIEITQGMGGARITVSPKVAPPPNPSPEKRSQHDS